MQYLILDFETVGINKDETNGYAPYADDTAPLPRENFPTDVSACLVDATGTTVISRQMIVIRGARRLSPWVQQHCSNVSLKKCDREGVDFSEVIQRLADMVGETPCTLVAHNVQYDWDDVLHFTAKERNLTETVAYVKLKSCPRLCTCVNEVTKRERVAFYSKKLQKWIGPSLKKLAASYDIPYDDAAAHDSAYDVEVTRKCLVHLLTKYS